MSLRSLASLFVMMVVCGGSTAAFGQAYNPLNNPKVSPYLNLLQSNQFGPVTYQGSVRPLIDQRDAILNQGQAINQLQNNQARAAEPRNYRASGVRATGHGARYLDYYHYYNNIREPRALRYDQNY